MTFRKGERAGHGTDDLVEDERSGREPPSAEIGPSAPGAHHLQAMVPQELFSLGRWLPIPKERGGYPYVEGDIKRDACATVVYPVVCMVAGFFAYMFGVGGGIAKGPLMMAMGVHLKVCHHHDAFGGALQGALIRLGRPLSPLPGVPITTTPRRRRCVGMRRWHRAKMRSCV